MATLPVVVNGVPPSAIKDRIAATGARLIYLTPTFQNPTGSVMPVSARKETARIVAELGVPLIDDRTMADLGLEGRHLHQSRRMHPPRRFSRWAR